MNNVTVLITGATGFLGLNLTRFLAKRRYRLVLLARSIAKAEHLKGIINDQDIDVHVYVDQNLASRDYRWYVRMLEDNNINVVVHAAAIVGEHRSISWSEYYVVNVLWTYTLAVACLKANINLRTFIYISTVSVYGTVPSQLPASENHPYNPDCNYSRSKILAEVILRKLHQELSFPLIILRPSVMYGPFDRGFMWKLIKMAKLGVIPLFNNNLINLTDVNFVTSVIEKLIQKPIYDVFNVADRPVRMYDIIRRLQKHINFRVLRVPIPGKLVEGLPISFIKTRLKLLSRPWHYDTTKLITKLKLEQPDTLKRLDLYLRTWYLKSI